MSQHHLEECDLLIEEHLIKCVNCDEKPGFWQRLFRIPPRRCENYRLCLMYQKKLELVHAQQVMSVDALEKHVEDAEAIAPNNPVVKALRRDYNRERDEMLA